MLSAAASLGTILLWDVDGGLTQIDKYLYSSEDYIKVSDRSWLYVCVGQSCCELDVRLAGVWSLLWSPVQLSSCTEKGWMPCAPGFSAAHSKVWISWGLPEAPWGLLLSQSYELWTAQLDPE